MLPAGRSARTMPPRNEIARLRGLCGEKGFRLERALMKDRWRLIDEKTGKPALNVRGSTAFDIKAAIAFLNRLKAPPAKR